MRKEEAEAQAAKREAHKNPALVGKEWQAYFDPARQTWSTRLVDYQHAIALAHMKIARQALRQGNMQVFMDAASDALLARVRATLPHPKEPT